MAKRRAQATFVLAALGALALLLSWRARSQPAPSDEASPVAAPAAPKPAAPVPTPEASPLPQAAPTAALPTEPLAASPKAPAKAAKPTARRPVEPATGDPFVDALANTTPEAARLNVDYARAHLPVPPEARTLIEMQRRGASRDELASYVRTSFPKGILIRAIALRWVGAGAERAPRAPLQGGTDPSTTIAPATAP